MENTNNLSKESLVKKLERISELYLETCRAEDKVKKFTPKDNYERKTVVPPFPGEYKSEKERDIFMGQVHHENSTAVDEVEKIYRKTYTPPSPIKPLAKKFEEPQYNDLIAKKNTAKQKRGVSGIVGVASIIVASSNMDYIGLVIKLSKVLAFIDSVKHKRFKTGCTIIPVSVSNKENLTIWGNKMGVSRAIEYMIEIGLLGIENNKYQFGAYYEKDNKSKSYYYYKENEDKIKTYCKERGIEKYIVQNKVYDVSEISKVHKDIDRSKVRFTSRIKLIKPVEVSKAEFEKQLTLCLYENYPGLRFHIEKANEINERYYKDYPEFRIRFQPNFTWSDDGLYVSGIGIRATNSMINIKKDKRVELLRDYGFILEKDINASVPRITLSLNKDEWVDESIDLYELIYRVMEPSGKFNTETREAIKKLHMRAYFDSGDKQTGHHTWLAMNQDGIERQDVCDTMATFRNAIVEAEGGQLYGSDIFYVESCVYLMTLYDLLTSRHKVWQVYDCFYSTGEEDPATFEFMVSNGVKMNFRYFVDAYWKKK